MEVVMAAKKDQKVCLMIEEELRDRVARAAFAADVSPSEMIRSCMLIALPLLERTPSLVSIIPTLPASGNMGVPG
jgi:hypothetical protein